MASRYATKSGVWSDVSVWDGGATLPGAGDVVRANGCTVTIDQNLAVSELRTDASSPAVAGGGFVVSAITGTRTIAAAINGAGATSHVLTISATSGTLVQSGTVTGGGGANVIFGVNITASGATITLGNIVGGSHPAGASCGLNIAAPASVTVGAITGAAAYGVSISAACTLTAASVIGGTSSSAHGISIVGAAASITILGDATAASATAINCNAAAIIDVRGTATANNNQSAVVSAGLANRIAVTVDAPNGRQALYAPGRIVPTGGQVTATMRDDATPANPVVLANYVANSPAPQHVRAGTTYGPSGQLTGTCAIPAAASVAYGVPVDATTGTAVLTGADVWSAEVAAGVQAGARLVAGATSDSVGAIVAAAVTA